MSKFSGERTANRTSSASVFPRTAVRAPPEKVDRDRPRKVRDPDVEGRHLTPRVMSDTSYHSVIVHLYEALFCYYGMSR